MKRAETVRCAVQGCESQATAGSHLVVHLGVGDTANMVCPVLLCLEHAEMFRRAMGRQEHFDMIGRDARPAVFC